MRGGWAVLVAALVSLAFARPEPLSVIGARVTVEGSVIAWGYMTLNGTRAPLLLRVEPVGRDVDAYYLTSDERISILDCIDLNGELVAAGYVAREGGSEALIVRLGRDRGWGYLLRGGPLFVKSLSLWNGSYVLAGPFQGSVDLDVAIVVLDDDGRTLKALSVGSPMYNDYVERIYSESDSIVIVGSTWSYNVSFSDALIIIVNRSNIDFISVGGPARDDGMAAVLYRKQGIAVLGSTVYYPASTSEAFYAVVSSESTTVTVVDWSGYIGFVDACSYDGGVVVLGYALIDGKSRGVVAKLDNGNIERGVLLAGESDVVPLAIGVKADLIVTAIKAGDALTIVLFDGELKPLSAYALGQQVSALQVLRVNLKGSYRTAEGWRVQRLSYVSRQISLEGRQLQVEARRLNLPVIDVEIVSDEYREARPLLQMLLRAVEANIPLLIIAVPILAIVVAVLVSKRRA